MPRSRVLRVQLLGWVRKSQLISGDFLHGEMCMRYEEQRSGFAYKLPKNQSLAKKYKDMIFK